ncbi:unnamed protein product [Didymodactylos carnosus]|uniref:Uncharacterized protein n=1 Tax=Didymodactylos carnosus TaxID=1234261 RepID=A0A815VGQ4_9BILA|nr:unnamed protein product [Didymodactylos carnosus]CAF4391500.1 unnamed protein product [Didymodactylos carnosus]
MKEKCARLYLGKEPFLENCNSSTEYGCLLADVDHVIVTSQETITFNQTVISLETLTFNKTVTVIWVAKPRPCIRLEQIGDGHIDCYGGLDERNRIGCSSKGMLGFDFKCNDECIAYKQQCQSRCPNRDDSQLCDKIVESILPHRPALYFTQRCSYVNYFWQSSTERYYCDQDDMEGSLAYRQKALMKRMNPTPYLLSYLVGRRNATVSKQAVPVPNMFSNMEAYFNREIEMIAHFLTLNEILEYEGYVKQHSVEAWICNRGIAVKKQSSIICFCPPSLYGEYCQYFSDRISVITSITNMPEKEAVIKILATFLLEEDVLDHEEFAVFRNDTDTKHLFYFVYSKPKQLRVWLQMMLWARKREGG